MNVTLQQSIAIYARASIAWFGDKALEKTGEKIKILAAQGDSDGVAVYERVKQDIRAVQFTHRRRRTFHLGR